MALLVRNSPEGGGGGGIGSWEKGVGDPRGYFAWVYIPATAEILSKSR